MRYHVKGELLNFREAVFIQLSATCVRVTAANAEDVVRK